MVERTVEITQQEGLHARPAADFVKTAGQFSSQIQVGKGGKFVDGKSILGVMSLAISQGETVTVRAEGSDEAQALTALVGLIGEAEPTC